MKKLFLLLLTSFMFATVTNTGATLTIDADVTVTINGDFINNGSVINNGYLEVNGFYDGENGSMSGNGEFCNILGNIPTGDLNSDCAVDVVDVVALLNFIFYGNDGIDGNEIEIDGDGDITGDGYINIIDIVALVTIILDN